MKIFYGASLTCSPAAFDTLQAVFRDTGTVPGDYDLILTGDLGDVGSRIVLELFAREGVALENYTDCVIFGGHNWLRHRPIWG